jgi:hypothetical protein
MYGWLIGSPEPHRILPNLTGERQRPVGRHDDPFGCRGDPFEHASGRLLSYGEQAHQNMTGDTIGSPAYSPVQWPPRQ